MPNAVVITGYGPPDVLTWAQVPLPELSEPTPGRAPGALDETMALLAEGRLRLRTHTSLPMQQAAEARRQLESGTVHQRIILTLP